MIRDFLFVYRHKVTRKIRCEFLELAQTLADKPDEWEHIATINPRAWVEQNWDSV